MTNLGNIINVARREFTVRVRTRSFVFGTVLLLVGVIAIALLPVIIRVIDRSDGERIGVHLTATDLPSNPVLTLSTLLNATASGGQSGDGKPDYVVTEVDDLTAARVAARAGEYGAILDIDRATDGDLSFTLYTDGNSLGRTSQLVQQVANAIAVSDRLDRLGIDPATQGTLFVPAEFAVAWTDPERTDPAQDTVTMIGQDMLAFGMTILIFLIIIMYGTWIAMSVVEEKSSRVMEVVLNAASPFQLMAGKVVGVGAVAFTQYAAIVVVGATALLVQDPIADLLLGSDGSSITLPEGLTLGLLLFVGVYGVLGFLLYSSLYAAAGSLVSRQEDVNTAVMPMTLVSTVGYMVGVYAAMGLLDIRAGWMTVLALVPFVSPFMMLGRITTDVATPMEIIVSIALLVVFIIGAVWFAARIYAAGVLLYGQRPGMRAMWRLVRSGS
ncbi:MAG TPA: ABC transporter permease [Candidatus Limnocylindrales bacterium]|nr:ABC transporter permease [Candidatus Limnocylindrales bacterium]